jgi:hypothetical protein
VATLIFAGCPRGRVDAAGLGQISVTR